MAIDLGIDIGTSSIQIFNAADNKIIADEPTVVIVKNDESKEIVAIGNEALEMIGKTPVGMTEVRPIVDGGITNFDIVVNLLKRLIEKNVKTVFSKIRVAVSIQSGAGDVEKRALEEAIISAGAKDVWMIEAALAGAIGAGIDINEPKGYIIVDVGAGLTEVAVVSLGGVVVSRTTRAAGNALDGDIIQYIKKKYNIEIAETTAEKVKKHLGAAIIGLTTDVVEVKGKDMFSGSPKGAVISANEINSAMQENVNLIIETIMCVLEETPPELASDLIGTGIILLGGGGKLRGLGRLIMNVTGLKVYLAEDPICSVASGAATALSRKNSFGNSLIQATRRKNY